ncbi:hypothetical protein CLOM_g849 [Closterium sp. NIES-68]|nr:hypothetical protein CLOM_g849 [Closterium sp. NIES-68]
MAKVDTLNGLGGELSCLPRAVRWGDEDICLATPDTENGSIWLGASPELSGSDRLALRITPETRRERAEGVAPSQRVVGLVSGRWGCG